VQVEKVQLAQSLVKACVTAAFDNVVAAARLEEAAQVLILAHTGMVVCCWVWAFPSWPFLPQQGLPAFFSVFGG
jgi:hypothetical protein